VRIGIMVLPSRGEGAASVKRQIVLPEQQEFCQRLAGTVGG
jgi:hypothetical protein